MRETRHEKALRYIAEQRAQVVSANDHGIRLEVRGSRSVPYIVWHGHDAAGELVTRCTCTNGADFHIRDPRCAHAEIARLLWREHGLKSNQRPQRGESGVAIAEPTDRIPCHVCAPGARPCRYARTCGQLRQTLRSLETPCGSSRA